MTWKRFDTYWNYGCSKHRCPNRAHLRACIQLRVPTWIYTCNDHKDAWT